MAEKRVTGTSPREAVASGPGGYPGYQIIYTYSDGTKEIRFFYEGDTPGPDHPGVLVDSWLDASAAEKPQTTPAGPPKEKDEGGRRYVWDETIDNWRDVGPAPLNAQERAAEENARAERERQAAIQRQAEQTAESNRLAQARLDADRTNTAADNARADSAEARAAAAANRPSIVSAPSNARKITQMGPDGTLTSVDNPNFDQGAYDRQAAKERASAERDRLALQIEAGKLSEQSAATRYKQWFEENVTLPMKRAEEARARAQELRQAQEAEDRRKQYAATYEKDRQTTALNIGQTAAGNFNANLPFQTGPAFGEQFAQALNSYQPGAPPAHFTKDAFTFSGPSIEAVARKATANALSNISPYAKAIATAGDRPLQVASYDQSMSPAAIAPTAAPPMPAAPDYSGMVDQFLQSNPYVPGANPDEEQP